MNTIHYKSYQANIVYDADDDILVGHIIHINDIIGFHGTSLKEIKAAFQEAVDDYLAHCKKTGKSPNKPYSGKVMFRIDPEVHAKAAMAAQLKGVSLNQWAEEVLGRAANSG
jgi:predicted HicB family RNase H-like nuclease